MAATINDTFDGTADSTFVGRSGWSETSGFYSVLRLDGSGAVKSLSYTENSKGIVHDTGSTSHYIKAIIGAGFISSAEFLKVQLGLSLVGSSPKFLVSYNSSTGQINIRGRRDGSLQSVTTITQTLSAGDELYFEQDDVAKTLVLKLNGTTIHTEPDTTYYNETAVSGAGLVLDYNGNPALSDIIRSFEAGSLSAADTTAPTLTTPTAAVTSPTTATGSVTTTEAGPAWAVMTTTATTPTAAQIKAGQNSAGAASPAATATLVSGANSAAFSFTGLTPTTGYYMHVVQDDTATPVNTSASVTSGLVTTQAADTTPPTLSAVTGTVKSNALIVLGTTTDEGNGTLYGVLTTSATAPTALQVRSGQNQAGAAAAWAGSLTIASAGAKSFNATGLTATTGYYAYFVHRDTSGNDSAVQSLGLRTTFRNGATGQWIIDHPGSFLSQCVQVGDEDSWFDWEMVTPPATGSWTEGPYADGTGVFLGPSATSMVILLRKDGVTVGNFTVFLYDTTVLATQGIAWSVINLISATQPVSWGVRNSVVATQSVAWSVQAAGMAAATQSLAWSVSNFTQGAQALAWSVRNTIVATQPVGWSVVAIVSATQIVAWEVQGYFIASASQAVAWSVLGATRVPSNELRVVRIDADGAGILGVFIMQPGEVLDYGFDFRPWLIDCSDAIASYAVTSTDDLPIVETDHTDGVIVALVDGTVDGASHKLTCSIQTDGGRTKEADITIRIKEF